MQQEQSPILFSVTPPPLPRIQRTPLLNIIAPTLPNTAHTVPLKFVFYPESLPLKEDSDEDPDELVIGEKNSVSEVATAAHTNQRGFCIFC
eukprot:GEMP01069223.1.p1 GENE.GEMP01069223.1~~GEMP01069223.1.p1  ORF type:complete len:102 (+),score=27.19 GEMP01069223.1:36-308(+)